MSTWTSSDLDRIGRADELQISSIRPDGSDRPFVTIWVVRVDDDLYVRSAYTSGNPWYRRATRAGSGRVRAGGVDHTVSFMQVDPADTPIHDAIDAAYHAKYDRYGARIVNTVVSAESHHATLRLDPR